jgi:tetratricopeptide (TPR) repeat protein
MEKTKIFDKHDLENALEGLGDSYFGVSMFSDSIKTYEKLERLSESECVKLRALRKATDAAFFLKDFGIMKRVLKRSEEFASADNLEYGRIQLNKGRSVEYDDMTCLVETEMKALKIFEREYSLRDVAWALVGTGAGSAALGNLEEGLEKMLRSAKLFEDNNDYNGQLAIYHQSGLAFFLQFGFNKEAIEMFSKVIGLCEKTGNHQRLAAAYAFWARILESEGNEEAALAKSLLAYKSAEKTDSFEMKALVLSNLVRQYSGLGEVKKAQNYMEELKSMPSKLLSFYFINIHLANALLLAANGEMPESRLCFEKSLREVTPLSGLGWQAWTKLVYAQVLEKMGNTIEAKKLCDEGKKTYCDIENAFSKFKVVLNLACQREISAGKEFEMRIDVVNVSRESGFLTAIRNVKSEIFEIKSYPFWVGLKNEDIDLDNKEIPPLQVETIKLTLEAKKPGKFTLRPLILYTDKTGQTKTAESNLLNLNVLPQSQINNS